MSPGPAKRSATKRPISLPPAPLGPAANSPMTRPLGALLICIIICVVYARSLNTPFIFDDTATVNENQSIRHLWPLVGNKQHPGPLNPAKEFPTAGRPLVNLTFALNFHFNGLKSTTGYHVVNLLIHVLATLVLWRIITLTLNLGFFEGRFAGIAEQAGWVSALLWGIHPLNTEAVVYITQRTELMVGLFYFATLLFSLKYWLAPESGKRRWVVLATLASLAGMASKEVMATAPIVVLLYERTFISGTLRAAWRRSWPLYVGLLGSWILLFALNIGGPRSGTAGFHLSLPAYMWWLIQSKMVWLYLKLAIWPWPLSLHYDMPYLDDIYGAWPWIIPTAILILGTAYFLWRRFAAGFVGAWFFLILSPTLIIPIVTEAGAERRMYLPLAGLVALLVAGTYCVAVKIFSTQRSKAGVAIVSRRLLVTMSGIAVLLALTMGAIDIRRLAEYQDEATLWRGVLNRDPDDSMAHFNLGILLANTGRYQEAAESYRRAAELDPGNADPQGNLAIALAKSGQVNQAIAHYEEALKLRPDFADAHNNLGLALIEAGRMSEAVPHFVRALEIKPDDSRAHYNLAKAMATLGQPQKAIEQFRLAIDANPEFVDAYLNLGVLLLQSGQVSEAVNQLKSAIQVDADSAEAHSNLGVALTQAKQPDQAIEQFEKALQLKPGYLQAAASLPQAYAEANQPQKATAAAETAMQLARNQGQIVIAQQIENWLNNYRAQHPSLPSSNAPNSNANKLQ